MCKNCETLQPTRENNLAGDSEMVGIWKQISPYKSGVLEKLKMKKKPIGLSTDGQPSERTLGGSI